MKLKIKIASNKIEYKPYSTAVKFIVSNNKIKDIAANAELLFNIKLTPLQKKNILSSSINEIVFPVLNGKPDEMMLVKVKLEDNFSNDFFRNYCSSLIQKMNNSQIEQIHLQLPNFELFNKYFISEEYFYQTFIEGLFLGSYAFDKYKTDKKSREIEVVLYSENEKELKNANKNAALLMQGVFLTRDFQNEPSNNLTPDLFAARIKQVFTNEFSNVSVKIFDDKALKKMGMNALLAVGEGSSNKPRLVVIDYNPVLKKKSKHITLVGKGITFDSGGISIKPAQGMSEMKGDMSGAAVVVGTIYSLAKINSSTKVTGIIPLAENMLSGSSFRPGDIIKSYSGKTIEIDNTDAEGRVILADALGYASKLKPDVIIDLATLTGACVVALGEFAAGLFTKSDKLAEKLNNSGLNVYERLWRLPLWDEYHQLNKSEVADVKNLGGKWAGSITAAKFLENFVDKELTWAHLDIAGVASPNSLTSYTSKYFTGFGVRLLINYIKNLN